MIGRELSHFTITAKLGEGGMGEVYRAVDSRLGREVALKVLPEGFASDRDRRARFEREARLLAAVNHPNIATILGLETVDGHDVLVMELVEGEGLDERIARGPLGVDEVLRIAGQIAAALAAAHDRGILHRDLKPANIRIRPDGTVKVLDFGLAKVWDDGEEPGELGNSPTLTHRATAQGMILGTAAYMSPEQARATPVDRRSDIWSFGVVVWEMLTGRPLFCGETVTDVLAEVLRRELDLGALPPATPAGLHRLLKRCLERDPARRWRDAGDLAIELEELAHPEEGGGGEGEASRERQARRWPWVAAVIAALGLGALGAWLVAGGRGAAGPARGAVTFEQKTFGQQVLYNARFLPDGRGVVYSAALEGNRPEVLLLQPGSLAPRRIAPRGTLFLSASSRGELAVLTDTTYLNHRVHVGTLARMSVDGSPRPLIESVRDADWGPDGELAIIRRLSGLDRLEYPPGNVLSETAGYASEPRVSADGERIAFLDHPYWIDDRGWVKVVDRAGNVETLTPEFWGLEGLAWAPGGERLVFSAGWGESLASGEPVLQARSVSVDGGDVRTRLGTASDLLVVDVAPDGRWLAIEQETFYGAAARPPGATEDVDLSWLDLSWSASLSSDGRTLLFSNGRGGPNYTVVMRRVDGSPISTLGEGDARGFSPDDRWAAGQISSPQRIALYPTGPGETRHLERGPIEKYLNAQWFPDGASLLVTGNEPGRPPRSYRQSIDGGPPVPVTPEGIVGTLSPQGDRVLAQVTPDRWELHSLDGGGTRPVPGLGAFDEPSGWSPDGTAIYVGRMGDVPRRLERVDLETGERSPSLIVGPPPQPGLIRVWMNDPVFDPDTGYAYNYLRRLGKLFVVHGAG